MNPLEELAAKIESKVPGTEVTLDAPEQETAPWFLDLRRNGETFTVGWSPKYDWFGFSAGEAVYGEGFEEVYRDPGNVLTRCLEALGVNRSP
jgi:hypothetical protein